MTTNETIEELKAALSELESDEGLERFVEGHGLQSRFFAFSWRSEHLEIDFKLPYARVLSDEEEQSLDIARIGAAIRIALLLLALSDKGTLLAEGEESISVDIDESDSWYSVFGGDGEVIDSGDDMEALVSRLNATISNVGDDIMIIWP